MQGLQEMLLGWQLGLGAVAQRVLHLPGTRAQFGKLVMLAPTAHCLATGNMHDWLVDPIVISDRSAAGTSTDVLEDAILLSIMWCRELRGRGSHQEHGEGGLGRGHVFQELGRLLGVDLLRLRPADAQDCEQWLADDARGLRRGRTVRDAVPIVGRGLAVVNECRQRPWRESASHDQQLGALNGVLMKEVHRQPVCRLSGVHAQDVLPLACLTCAAEGEKRVWGARPFADSIRQRWKQRGSRRTGQVSGSRLLPHGPVLGERQPGQPAAILGQYGVAVQVLQLRKLPRLQLLPL